MRTLVCALVLVLPSVASAQRSLRVLTNPQAAARETVLVDQLRIYTRDLGREVRLGGPAPFTLDAVELERVAADARRDGDEVVVWFGERNGAPVLLALRVPTHELRETPVEPEDPSRTARTLALKVRSLLSSTAAQPDPTWSVPPEAKPVLSGAEGPPPAPTPTPPEQGPDLAAAIAPTPAPAPAPAPVAEVHAAPPRPTSRVYLDLGAAYGVTVPTSTDWVRHGLTVRLAAPWGRLPAAVFVDASFTTAPTATVDGSPVSARVWPIGVGVAWWLHRPRWQLTLGPRASLQIVDASATAPDGRSGSALRYAAGLGALAEAGWLFSKWVGGTLSVTAEALVPRLAFAAGGPNQTDLGYFQIGVNIGLIVSLQRNARLGH
jgi:hypothetical protein